MIKKPFHNKWKSLELLEIVHIDICGPLRPKPHRGMKYFVSFIDDFSRYGYIYLL